jgi:hypothetical protein
MQAPVIHMTPLTLIRRQRLLPAPGRVLAHEGQKVTAADVVAEGWSPGSHVLIDIRRMLGLTRADQAEKLIVVNEGDHLAAGAVIAESKGLLAQKVSSPVEGQLVAVHNGRALIETPGQVIRLTAGFAGVVTGILSNRGVVIETHGALVQGVWGNDRFDQGMLLAITHGLDEELTEKALDVSMRGAVIFAGYCKNPAVLRMADDLPLRGLVLSSLAPELRSQAAAMATPLIVVEGFGRLPYSRVAFKILSTSEKRDACIKASRPNPFSGERPEIILPLPAIGDEGQDAGELCAGLTVRIIDPFAPSQMGMIAQIRPGLVRLANGLTVQAADVKLDNNEVVTVPLANLEIIE